jgi:membrane protease YdiL (CAAX protease family)
MPVIAGLTRNLNGRFRYGLPRCHDGTAMAETIGALMSLTIDNSIPPGQIGPGQRTNSRYKIVAAAVSFVVGMVLLFFLGGWMQINFGMVGMIGTELLILAIAVLSALAGRVKLSQAFRVRRSGILEWLGSLAVYLAAFCGSLAASMLLVQLFPAISETGEALSGFITSGGLVLALIGVVLLPGICEEAWHRGYLLSSLGSIRSVAVRVIIMGIVFGVFHLDHTRLAQTMILGFALSYMRIKTDNMLVPVAMHCLNNLFSVSMTFLMLALPQEAVAQSTEAGTPAWMLACMLLFFVALSLMFLTLGRYLFGLVERRRQALLPLQAVTAAAGAPGAVGFTSPAAPMPVPPPGTWPSPAAQTPSAGQPLAYPPPAPGSISWAPPAPSAVLPVVGTAPVAGSADSAGQRTRTVRAVTVICICGGLAVVSCISCFALTAVTGFGT